MHGEDTDGLDGSAAPAALSISDHHLIRRIGSGSYGEVWLARSLMGLYRAVKVVYRRRFAEARPYERELAGIRSFEPVSRSHEGFVDVLHIGQNEAAGCFYYIMELADDLETGQQINPETYQPRTLSRELKRRQRLSFPECAELGLLLSRALSQLHRQGLVHRDIKPSNVIFVNGTPKLADIGLVAGIEDACSFVGTDGYVPREGTGKPPADIFALGKVLYECCTGLDRMAFPRLPAGLAGDGHHDQLLEFNEVLLRACHHDLSKRYTSAEDLHADLAFVLNGRSVKRLRQLEAALAKIKKAAVVLAAAAAFLGPLAYYHQRVQLLEAEQRQRQIGAHLSDGLHALEAGQLPQSLPPLVAALRLDDPARAAQHRLRLGTTLEQCPKLLQMWAEDDAIYSGCLSPDGTLAVLATDSRQARVVEVQTGRALSSPFGPTSTLRSARFSPDGSLVLMVGFNGRTNVASLWHWRTGANLLEVEHSNSFRAALFHPQGDRLLLAGNEPFAREWNLSTGDWGRAYEGHSQGVLAAAFSHDGKKLATAGRDKLALIWDAGTGACLRRLPHPSWVYYAAFSPNDRRVVTGCFDKSARVWEVDTGRELLPPLEHDDVVGCAAFSPDGRLILTGSWDRTARLWEADTGRPALPNPILPHSSRVMHAAFHPDGHRVLTVCLDGTARLWDLAGASESPPPHSGRVSADGTKHLVATNGFLVVADTQNPQQTARLRAPAGLGEAGLNRNGNFLLTLAPAKSPSAAKQSQLEVWHPETGRRVFTLAPFPGGLSRVVISDRGRWLAVASSNQARIYELKTGTLAASIPEHPGGIEWGVFSPDEDFLLTKARRKLSLWDTLHARLVWSASMPMELKSAAFSHDGRRVAACLGNDQLTECPTLLLDARTGQTIGQPLQHGDGVLQAAFSPDDRRVVTASEDFSARIWNLGDLAHFRKLPHKHQVFSAVFSPNGAWVLTASRDGTARLWDAESGEPLSPPLPHGRELARGEFLRNYAFFTADSSGLSWQWRIQPETRPIQDLDLLAGVLNGIPHPGLPTAIAAKQLYAAWVELKRKYPADFQTTPAELAAWHRRQAQQAFQARQWPAALLHAERLASLLPDDPTAPQLLEQAREGMAPAPLN